MSASASLIPELESVIRHGSPDKRAATVKRIANLFIDGAAYFNEDHVGLFDDVLYMKNYNESILKSTSNAVITFDEDVRIVTANEAARTLMEAPDGLIGAKRPPRRSRAGTSRKGPS